MPTGDGKLRVEDLLSQAWGFDDPDRAQPQAVTLTQATETGMVYTPEEIAAITEFAHGHGLRVHLDGARLANAAAHLGVALRALTTDVGGGPGQLRWYQERADAG